MLILHDPALFDFIIDTFFELVFFGLCHHIKDMLAGLFIFLEIGDKPLLLLHGFLVLPEAPLHGRDLTTSSVIVKGHLRGVT